MNTTINTASDLQRKINAIRVALVNIEAPPTDRIEAALKIVGPIPIEPRA